MEYELITKNDLETLGYQYMGFNYANSPVFENKENILLLDKIKGNNETYKIWHSYKKNASKVIAFSDNKKGVLTIDNYFINKKQIDKEGC